jgi:hypothetical protein
VSGGFISSTRARAGTERPCRGSSSAFSRHSPPRGEARAPRARRRGRAGDRREQALVRAHRGLQRERARVPRARRRDACRGARGMAMLTKLVGGAVRRLHRGLALRRNRGSPDAAHAFQPSGAASLRRKMRRVLDVHPDGSMLVLPSRHGVRLHSSLQEQANASCLVSQDWRT